MKKIILFCLFLSFQAHAGLHNKDIIEVAQNAGQFKTLLQLLDKTDLTSAIKNTKKLTLFAPTDEAFSKLSDETIEFLHNNPEVLKKVLLYHVSPKKLKAKKVSKNYEVKTLAGLTIKVDVSEDGVQLNDDANVTATDIKAKNGVIHILDSVLTFNDQTPQNNIQTVEYVELDRYLGTWYEIARYPNSFQKKCKGTKATYGLSKKGKYIKVLNECQIVNGKIQKGKALATVKNKETNAELNVSFVPLLNLFGFFGGDYNILELGNNYEYVLVGDKIRKTFWILSREKEMSESMYQEMLDLAEKNGYRRDLIRRTPTWM